eukprot:1052515-Amphidinium_carterae.1
MYIICNDLGSELGEKVEKCALQWLLWRTTVWFGRGPLRSSASDLRGVLCGVVSGALLPRAYWPLRSVR